MKQTRKVFKSSLKYCKINENNIRNQKLVKALENKDSKEFWRQIRTNNKGKDVNSKFIDGSSDQKEIAEKFSNFFRNIFAENESYENISGLVPDGAVSSDFDFVFTPDDVELAIKSLKPNIGPDSIHSNHLKFAPKCIYSLISKLFLSFLYHSYVPDKLAFGIITPFVKDKFIDNSNISNYRPIILSSVFLKILEYCILDKIQMFIVPNDRQHGFRKGYSTSTAGFIFKESILQYFNGDSPVYAAFLDISKAFDKVDHKILMNKLLSSGVPVALVNLIGYWYSHQNVSVRFNGSMSDTWLLRTGVRQGGILSPLFFSLYINDVLNNISNCNFGCKLGTVTSNIIAYADDVAIMAPSLTSLQCLIDIFYNEISILKLKINTNKSVCVKFSKKGNALLNDNLITCGNNFIKFSSSVEYLGFKMDFKLNDKEDIIRVRNKFYSQFNIVLRKFHFSDINVLLQLFDSYCTGFYGMELWFNLRGCSTLLNQFSVGFHKAIKKIFNVPYYFSNHDVCEAAGLFTFQHFINFNQTTFE